ncbi:MAG: 50S ribosomal protein L3 [archaeon]
MPTAVRPRYGSLQFYPRKRAAKFLHKVNWKTISNSEQGILGFIAYKVGMASALVKDKTEKVMTSKKQIVLPATILEVPNMKIFSVRFYKHGKAVQDIIVSNDKELKKKIKTPKETKKIDNSPKDYDDIKIIVYSLPKTTSIKKTPDLTEIAIQAEDKLGFVKSLIGKEINLDNFSKSNLVDVRGLTKGKGTQGPVKRFGIKLKFHKSEKGRRRPGSLAPWHPARVTFMAPMAGQLGLFSRITYNLYILSSGKISDKDINPKAGFKNYGKIKTSYIIVNGSIQGPSKRQLVLTPSFRPTKKQSKRKLEFLEVLNK